MKRPRDNDDTPSAQKYPATEMSKESRNVVQRIVGAMKNLEYTIPEIEKVLEEADITIPTPALYRYIRLHQAGAPSAMKKYSL